MVTAEVTERQAHRQRDKVLASGARRNGTDPLLFDLAPGSEAILA